MELTSDMIAVQGIMMSILNTIGKIYKNKQQRGKRRKILHAVAKINKFLSSKKYMKDGEINNTYDEQLEDIVFFLAINTAYNEPLELDECMHLINVMPQLSKCLLMNIVYDLNLCKYYCTVFEKLPISCSIQLLEETIPCLKKSVPKTQLQYAFMFLKSAINKLNSINDSKQVEDSIEKISSVTNIILHNLTGLYLDQAKKWRSVQIYQHMGYCLLHLFELLLYCDKTNTNLRRVIDNIIGACCSLVNNVTVTVFCSWAEIDEDDEPLQNIISEKAYLVVEKYQKYEEAKELLTMLVSMARKPKTLTELKTRQVGFQALLNTEIFNNNKAVECVYTCAHMCTEDNVTRLLNLCIQTHNIEANKLAIKCASTLNLEKLILVITRHYYKNKFNQIPMQMTVLSKIFACCCYRILQFFFGFIYDECLKNVFYTTCLKDTFSVIKEIAEIDRIGKLTIFPKDVVLTFLYDLLEQYHTEKKYEDINYILQIFLGISIKIPATKQSSALIHLLINIMNDCRCTFMKFDNIRYQNTKHVVDILTNLDGININNSFKAEPPKETDDDFTLYYKKYLSSEIDVSLSRYLIPDFNMTDYPKCVIQLLQIMPCSVTREWLNILEDINSKCGREKTMELLTDVMILLCQTVSQNSTTNEMFIPLKYCIQNFGTVIQVNTQTNPTLSDEINITKQVCRFLHYLPEVLRREEGLSLINLLSDRSLKFLANDREFLCLIMHINDKTLCQVLAKIITN
ncbi:hypothetical protein NQ317_017031 [Molorchus minor]|uniref:Uncharacterized protein n=1 Tax=Molorchus minor TaxID=1323400 RepID=A0ABQ9K487_9CUCU|nr:hypothetical protein NQ317_017031 [Molorchus minor]